MRCHSVACGTTNQNAISNASGYAQLPRWFWIPCVLAIPPWPRLRHAKAKEEEAETL